MPTTQKLAIEMSVEINAPQEKVWAFLASEEGMKAWLGPEVFSPELGSEVLILVDYGETKYEMSGEVVTLDPPHTLAFTWRQHEIGQEPWPEPTTVTISLEPTPNGTQVSLVHSGFEKLPESYREPEYQSYVEGWKVRNVMARLKEQLESLEG